jgi:hypothetical protein
MCEDIFSQGDFSVKYYGDSIAVWRDRHGENEELIAIFPCDNYQQLIAQKMRAARYCLYLASQTLVAGQKAKVLTRKRIHAST